MRTIFRHLAVAAAILATGSAVMAQVPETSSGGFGGMQIQNNVETSQQWKDINYASDNNAYHTCDIYLPKEKRDSYPVVVHIYGSAWFSNSSKGMADIGTIVKALLDAGYAVVCPNHRSSGDAKWPAQIQDIKAVIRFIRGEAPKYKFDPSFVAVSGFSSGGHLSSITAATSGTKSATVGRETIDLEGDLGAHTSESSEVSAACVWSGPIEFMTAFTPGVAPEEVLIGQSRDEAMDKYRTLSTTTFIDSNDPPFIIFHGEKDNVVPCSQGQRLFDALNEAGVKATLILEPEGGHGFNMYSDTNLSKMVEFINAVRVHAPNEKR